MAFGDYMNNWSVRAGIPAEAAPGQTVTELFGNCRVMIENHRGILALDTETIDVKISCGCLRVLGSCLTVAFMSDRQLVITGKIFGVTVNGGVR